MIKIIRLSLYITFALTGFIHFESRGCTSAVVSAELNPYGRPLLWKHRDTSTIDNKVEYIAGKDGDLSYVALFNTADKELKEAWMGMNEAGFAVMNTASYNIKNDNVPASKMDKEGILMTFALRTCRSIEDFRKLLDSYPRPMGVEANFGVIDATGAGAYFETNNDSYVEYNLIDSKDGILVRTNYSHSGRPNEGYGFIREANANHLLDSFIKDKNVTPELLTETLSRSFYHDLKGRDCSQDNDRWIIDQDFIPRYKSTATIVIEGCRPLKPGETLTPEEMKKEYIMWTGMGYPPCSEIIPVWCSEDGVNDALRGLGNDGHSEMGDIVKKRRDDVFSLKKGNRDKYINMRKLYNEEGTGYVQILSPANMEVYRTVRKMRDGVNF